VKPLLKVVHVKFSLMISLQQDYEPIHQQLFLLCHANLDQQDFRIAALNGFKQCRRTPSKAAPAAAGMAMLLRAAVQQLQ